MGSKTSVDPDASRLDPELDFKIAGLRRAWQSRPDQRLESAMCSWHDRVDSRVRGNDGRAEKSLGCHLARLADLRLTLHEPRTQVRRVEEGIPWLGFVVYPGHRRLKRRNVVKASRRLRAKIADTRSGGDAEAEALAASWQGWTAHARHAQSPGLIEIMRCRVGIDEAKPKQQEFRDRVRGQAP